jgi:hypothetical protein
MNKIVSIIISFFLFGLVLAQEPDIELREIRFGEDPKEVYFTVHNIGQTDVRDVTVFVDGQPFKNIKTKLAPQKGVEFSLFLDSGEYLIEAQTSEQAYDSVDLLIGEGRSSEIFESDSYVKSQSVKLVVVLVIVTLIILLLIKKLNL